jgi:hypothetical protein
MTADSAGEVPGRAAIALEALAVGALMTLVSVYALRQLWDIDVFWHVQAGRLIVEQGLGVARDTFSAIDPERPWIPLHWGYHVLVYLIDRAWGLQGLRLAHAGVQIAAFALFYWTCRRRLALGPLVSLALFALLTVLYADRFRARPHVLNLVFEIVLLPWLARGPRLFDRRAFAGAAVVFGLWANLHAGGAFVFLVLAATVPAAATIDHLLAVPGREGDLRRAWTWFACALVPALLSPLLVRAILHTFTMVDAAYEYTFEWHPAFRLLLVGTLPAHFIAGAFPTVLAVALAFPVAKILGPWAREGLAGLRRALGAYELHRLLLAVALLCLAHRSIRFIYMATFALVIAAPLVGRAFAEVRVTSRARQGALGLALAGLVAAGYQSRITGIYGSFGEAVRVIRHDGPVAPAHFPEAQADFLVRTGFEGKIFCQSAWGGYLLYRLWPHAHVLVDGRGNHDETVTRDLRVLGTPANMADPANGPAVLSIYDHYGTDVIVHPHPTWPKGYLPPQDRWVPVQVDERGSIWVRPRGAGARYLEHLAALQGEPPLTRPGDAPR